MRIAVEQRPEETLVEEKHLKQRSQELRHREQEEEEAFRLEEKSVSFVAEETVASASRTWLQIFAAVNFQTYYVTFAETFNAKGDPAKWPLTDHPIAVETFANTLTFKSSHMFRQQPLKKLREMIDNPLPTEVDTQIKLIVSMFGTRENFEHF